MAEFTMSDYWWVEGDKAWFVSTWTKAVYEIDLITKIISYIDEIPDNNESMHLYISCIKHGDLLYFFPDLGENIYRYNLNTRLWECLYKGYFKGDRASVKILYKEKDIAILSSRGLNAILAFNMKKGEFVERYEFDFNGVRLWQAAYRHGIVYLTDRDKPVIYVKNLKTGKTDSIVVQGAKNRFDTLTVIDNDIFLTGKEKCIYNLSLEEHQVVKIALPINFGEYVTQGDLQGTIVYDPNRFVNPLFIESVFANGKIYYIPYITNAIICLNISNRDVYLIKMPKEIETRTTIARDCAVKFTELKAVYKNNIILCSYKNLVYEAIDILEDSFATFTCGMNFNVINHIFYDGFVNESEDLSLQDLIPFVACR